MNQGKIYHADRRRSGRQVFVTSETGTMPLQTRTDIVAYSSAPHDWGYLGGPAAQLSIDILADFFGDTETAYKLHQVFQFAVIRRAEFRGFKITAEQIMDAVRDARMLSEQVG